VDESRIRQENTLTTGNSRIDEGLMIDLRRQSLERVAYESGEH
jgi:hypothetical protein